jgi:hypothetical protein
MMHGSYKHVWMVHMKNTGILRSIICSKGFYREMKFDSKFQKKSIVIGSSKFFHISSNSKGCLIVHVRSCLHCFQLGHDILFSLYLFCLKIIVYVMKRSICMCWCSVPPASKFGVTCGNLMGYHSRHIDLYWYGQHPLRHLECSEFEQGVRTEWPQERAEWINALQNVSWQTLAYQNFHSPLVVLGLKTRKKHANKKSVGPSC